MICVTALHISGMSDSTSNPHAQFNLVSVCITVIMVSCCFHNKLKNCKITQFLFIAIEWKRIDNILSMINAFVSSGTAMVTFRGKAVPSRI